MIANSLLVDSVRARVRARAAQELPPDNLTLRTDRPNVLPSELKATTLDVFGLGPGKPCALYAWVLRREQAYFEGPGASWPAELICFAACRDFISWSRRSR